MQNQESQFLVINTNNTSIPNTLIDLGVAINVMIKEKMEKIQLTGLHPTLIVLQLADRSTVKPEGILEDVMVFVDS
jgi:ribosome biogenesis SPOUT family RNA methylase Rps3